MVDRCETSPSALPFCAKRLRIPGAKGLDWLLSRCSFVYLLMFSKTGLLFKEFPVTIMPSHRTGVPDFFRSVPGCAAMPETLREQSWPLMSCCKSAGSKDKSFAKLMCKVHEEWGMLGATKAFSLDACLPLTLFQAALEIPWNKPSRREKIGVRKYEVTHAHISGVQAAGLFGR